MPDKSYCCPNIDVLINKLGIKNVKELIELSTNAIFRLQ